MGKYITCCIVNHSLLGKAWGNKNNPPVLALHGIMDNASSFDLLIPLLPRNYYYLCIDLPGHGKSSHFPGCLLIHTMDFVVVCKMLTDYFKKEQYILMGHSYGGQIGVKFAQLYPEYVQLLILLDTVYSIPFPVHTYSVLNLHIINSCLKYNEDIKTKNQKTYKYGEALHTASQKRNYETISPEAAKILLRRHLIKCGENQYKFSFDQRLKFYMNPLHDNRYATELLRACPIRCPVLVIFSNDYELQRKVSSSVIKYLKTQKNFTFKYVDGCHSVHLTHPERVAPIIVDFLSKINKNKL